MIDIDLRAKRKDNGEWEQGYAPLMWYIIHKIDPDKDTDIKIDINTMGRFTGLHDKNGTKIFEGDIVKRLFYFERPVLSVVTFKNGAFGLEWNRGKVKEFSAFTSICNCTYEVIGNIHDNPELLEGGAADE